MRLALALCLGVASCGAAPAPREEPPECAGDGEAGAVAAALRAYDSELEVEHDWTLYNQVLQCTVTMERSVITLSPDAHPPRRQPFAWSCWARGGPEDGQCGAFGEGRGPAPEVPPEPSLGRSFSREFALRIAELEGDAVVIVTIGALSQAHQAFVVRDGGEWRVVQFHLAWTT